MKIGFLIVSDGWAGAESALYNLLKSSVKFGHETVLFTNKEMIKYYSDIKRLRIKNIGKMKLRGIKQFEEYKEASRNLSHQIEEETPEIIIIFLAGAIRTYFIIKNKIKIPILLSLRGGEIELHNNKNFLRKIKNFFLLISLRGMLRKSVRIHSHSRWQIQNLPERCKKKIVVIPNGVDTELFKPLKNVEPEKDVILYTGRYLDWKGIREIISVSKQLPRYKFWFAGQGPLVNEIKGKNVKNLRFKTTEELVKLYNKATICIFPSWHEPFGNTAREAMACQKAVIVTPKGFSETVENGKEGIIIPAKDEKALKDAIVDLMTNEKKRKILEKNARKKALRCSWDKVAEQYLEVFRKVIEENKKTKD